MPASDYFLPASNLAIGGANLATGSWWENLYKEYYQSFIDQGYSSQNAMQLASQSMEGTVANMAYNYLPFIGTGLSLGSAVSSGDPKKLTFSGVQTATTYANFLGKQAYQQALSAGKSEAEAIAAREAAKSQSLGGAGKYLPYANYAISGYNVWNTGQSLFNANDRRPEGAKIMNLTGSMLGMGNPLIGAAFSLGSFIWGMVDKPEEYKINIEPVITEVYTHPEEPNTYYFVVEQPYWYSMESRGDTRDQWHSKAGDFYGNLQLRYNTDTNELEIFNQDFEYDEDSGKFKNIGKPEWKKFNGVIKTPKFNGTDFYAMTLNMPALQSEIMNKVLIPSGKIPKPEDGKYGWELADFNGEKVLVNKVGLVADPESGKLLGFQNEDGNYKSFRHKHNERYKLDSQPKYLTIEEAKRYPEGPPVEYYTKSDYETLVPYELDTQDPKQLVKSEF